MVDQPFLIFAHTKKIVGFSDHFGLCEVIRALPVNQFPFRVKALTTNTIEPLIITEIDITIFLHPTKNQFNSFFVLGIRGANKIIIADIQPGPEVPEQLANPVHIFLWRLVGFLGGDGNLVSVLICTGKKKCLGA